MRERKGWQLGVLKGRKLRKNTYTGKTRTLLQRENSYPLLPTDQVKTYAYKNKKLKNNEKTEKAKYKEKKSGSLNFNVHVVESLRPLPSPLPQYRSWRLSDMNVGKQQQRRQRQSEDYTHLTSNCHISTIFREREKFKNLRYISFFHPAVPRYPKKCK